MARYKRKGGKQTQPASDIVSVVDSSSVFANEILRVMYCFEVL